MHLAAIAALAIAFGQAGPDAGTPAGQAATDEVALRERVEVVAAAIDRMQKAAAQLKDFTATFHKKEFKGKQLPQELIELKFRAAPRGVYLKWVGSNYRGQEVLWQRGWNDDQLRVHTNTFPDLTVNLKPESWIAMRNTRHPTTQAGFDYTIDCFVRDLVVGRRRIECVRKAVDAGVQQIYGTPSHCYELELDKDLCREMYSYKARLCVSEELGLPSKVEVWDKADGEVRQVEDYGYESVKVDAGLTDKDFDPKNKAYGF